MQNEQMKQWENVLKMTSGDRNAMFQERIVPETYRIWKDRAEYTECTIGVPAVNVPVKCRIYMSPERRENCIVYIYLHGGGFYYPWTEDDALYCSEMACRTEGIVVDVDYALTTDYAFPVALEQAYEAARWTKKMCKEWHADENKIVIGGCSAGGCLSAAVCLLAGERGDVSFALQILDCAALDNTTPPEYKPEADLAMMPIERMQAFSALYMGGNSENAYLPACSPAFAPDEMLAKTPPALIITAGKCGLRFENELYAKRLTALGIEVTMKQFRQSEHAFTIRMLGEEWQEAHEFIVRRLHRVEDQEVEICC